MPKLKTLHIYTRLWKRRTIRKTLQKIKDADETKKFNFIEWKEKNKFVASVYNKEDGDALQESILAIDPKVKMDLF
jgi:hypothetical protein